MFRRRSAVPARDGAATPRPSSAPAGSAQGADGECRSGGSMSLARPHRRPAGQIRATLGRTLRSRAGRVASVALTATLLVGAGLLAGPSPASAVNCRKTKTCAPSPSSTTTSSTTTSTTSTTSTTTTSTTTTTAPPTTSAWYVSKSAPAGGDGKSWATAWNELNAINWSVVQSGGTIYLDGGATSCGSNYQFNTTRPGVSCGMMYTTTLTPARSGVTIRRSTEAGHNGTVVLYGGRPTALPYCHQSSYSPGGTGAAALVNIGAVSGITLDGVTRSGIMGYGAQQGIVFSSTSAANATDRKSVV